MSDLRVTTVVQVNGMRTNGFINVLNRYIPMDPNKNPINDVSSKQLRKLIRDLEQIADLMESIELQKKLEK